MVTEGQQSSGGQETPGRCFKLAKSSGILSKQLYLGVKAKDRAPEMQKEYTCAQLQHGQQVKVQPKNVMDIQINSLSNNFTVSFHFLVLINSTNYNLKSQ